MVITETQITTNASQAQTVQPVGLQTTQQKHAEPAAILLDMPIGQVKCA